MNTQLYKQTPCQLFNPWEKGTSPSLGTPFAVPPHPTLAQYGRASTALAQTVVCQRGWGRCGATPKVLRGGTRS